MRPLRPSKRSVIRRPPRVAWRAFMRHQDHNGPDRAAAVAYYTLMSLLPMLIFLISLGVAAMGSFEEAYRGTLFLISGVVVHLDQIHARTRCARSSSASLRFQCPPSFLLAWTSRRIFGSLFSALERVFGVPGRSFAQRQPGSRWAWCWSPAAACSSRWSSR